MRNRLRLRKTIDPIVIFTALVRFHSPQVYQRARYWIIKKQETNIEQTTYKVRLGGGKNGKDVKRYKIQNEMVQIEFTQKKYDFEIDRIASQMF